ncbi:aminoglycoside phosphotransferase family protein [Micromonosporaceae bacterium Da 78-11]
MVTEKTVDPRPTIDDVLVRRLVDAQFPQWAGQSLRRSPQAGSDHVIYRLGTDLSVRLPRHAGAIGQAEKDFRWLPQLAPRLPLAVPVPEAVGQPGFGYPWPWGIARWLDGETATVEALAGSTDTAVALAGFLHALQGFAPQDVPALQARPELAEQPLAYRDQATRSAIAELGDVFDGAAMTRLWDAALSAPGWPGRPVWFHGDFHTGNLLTLDGQVSAVIDFGGLGIGDPACDLTIAFTLMSAPTRAAFRGALGVDDDTWTRGRGWALATGLNAYRSYADTNARVAEQTTRQITEALAG